MTQKCARKARGANNQTNIQEPAAFPVTKEHLSQ